MNFKEREQEDLRQDLLKQFTEAVDDTNWNRMIELYEQLVKIIGPNDIVMKLIKMDMKSIPDKIKTKEVT